MLIWLLGPLLRKVVSEIRGCFGRKRPCSLAECLELHETIAGKLRTLNP